VTSPFSIVCLSAQEWDASLPTNRQQIMQRAAARGHAVLFVETGTFLGRHALRLVRGGDRRELVHQLSGAVEAAPGIAVRKGLNAAPWGHRRRTANRINARLTAAAVRRAAARLPQPVVLWVYDPCAAEMIGRCGESAALYDCVDDYAELAGPDEETRALILAMDREAAARADVVSTTTRFLHERHRLVNPGTHLVRNVGDYAHFARAAAVEKPAVVQRPVLGFAGNLHPGKVDFELLAGLARARPDWTLLLVGPAQPAAREPLERLLALDNVHWDGPAPYQALPERVAVFEVGLIPYVSNAYTRSCFPLKLYEYLAAGKPVVAAGLPELAGMEPDVALASGAEAFAAAVERALDLRLDEDRRRRMGLAARNTWDDRTTRLLGLAERALAA
jgi:glycosyltransferase involved in cell wall biosynthesis